MADEVYEVEIVTDMRRARRDLAQLREEATAPITVSTGRDGSLAGPSVAAREVVAREMTRMRDTSRGMRAGESMSDYAERRATEAFDRVERREAARTRSDATEMRRGERAQAVAARAAARDSRGPGATGFSRDLRNVAGGIGFYEISNSLEAMGRFNDPIAAMQGSDAIMRSQSAAIEQMTGGIFGSMVAAPLHLHDIIAQSIGITNPRGLSYASPLGLKYAQAAARESGAMARGLNATLGQRRQIASEISQTRGAARALETINPFDRATAEAVQERENRKADLLREAHDQHDEADQLEHEGRLAEARSIRLGLNVFWKTKAERFRAIDEVGDAKIHLAQRGRLAAATALRAANASMRARLGGDELGGALADIEAERKASIEKLPGYEFEINQRAAMQQTMERRAERVRNIEDWGAVRNVSRLAQSGSQMKYQQDVILTKMMAGFAAAGMGAESPLGVNWGGVQMAGSQAMVALQLQKSEFDRGESINRALIQGSSKQLEAVLANKPFTAQALGISNDFRGGLSSLSPEERTSRAADMRKNSELQLEAMKFEFNNPRNFKPEQVDLRNISTVGGTDAQMNREITDAVNEAKREIVQALKDLAEGAQ